LYSTVNPHVQPSSAATLYLSSFALNCSSPSFSSMTQTSQVSKLLSVGLELLEQPHRAAGVVVELGELRLVVVDEEVVEVSAVVASWRRVDPGDGHGGLPILSPQGRRGVAVHRLDVVIRLRLVLGELAQDPDAPLGWLAAAGRQLVRLVFRELHGAALNRPAHDLDVLAELDRRGVGDGGQQRHQESERQGVHGTRP
jgi:hypothetical protein